MVEPRASLDPDPGRGRQLDLTLLTQGFRLDPRGYAMSIAKLKKDWVVVDVD